MNIIKKIYARTYEGVFKIALPFLPYRKPVILFNIENISSHLIEKNFKKPMIVTDRVIRSIGLIDILTKSLDEKNITYSIYDNVVQNPTSDNVEEVRLQYIENQNDCIIAFGGGSAIDCAKALGARIARPKKTLSKMAGILKIIKRIPYLIAIPTTAGTGSETTLASVVVDSVTRHKYAINDFPLIPKVAVLDSVVTRTLPKHITATTGVDALTHAIEAYIGRSTTRETRRDSLEAIRLIFENLEEAYNNHSEEALKNMLYASHLAGRAFSKSYVGYVHSLAHALGGKYNTPHGLANAVILPHVLKAYDKSIYKKIKKISIYIGLCSTDTSYEEAFSLFNNKLDSFLKNLSIPTYFNEIKETDLDELVNYAYKEAYPLYPVPQLWDKKDLKNIYLKVMNNND